LLDVPDDIEAHVKAFATWARGSGRAEIEPDVISTFLQLQTEHLGERGVRPGTLTAVLIDLFPCEVTADDDYIAAVGPTISAYAEFLRANGEGESADVLSAELAEVLPDFKQAMGDPVQWDRAKLLFLEMVDSGVDVNDQTQIDAWVDEFNARPEEKRQPAAEMQPYLELPAVRVPERSALAAAARTADHIVMLRRLVDWLGERREITKVGWPRVNDAIDLAQQMGLADEDEIVRRQAFGGIYKATDISSLTAFWNVALASGIVRTTKTRAYPGETAAGLRPEADDEEVLATFEEVFAAATSLEPDHVGYTVGPIIEHAVGVLTGLYMGRATPDELKEVIVRSELEKDRELWDGPDAAYPYAASFDVPGADDDLAQRKARWLGDLLEWLAGFGLLTFDAENVQLTSLGLWAVSGQLSANGVSAPIVEPLTNATAVELLAGLAGLDTEDAAEERDAWIAGRGPAEAAGEVLSAASAGDSAARLMAMDVLIAIGEPAVAPLKEWLDDPEIWRHVAQILELRGVPSPRRLTEPDRIWMLVEVHSVALSSDAISEDALPTDDPAEAEQILERMARTGHPAAADVLTRIGDLHGDKRIAKAARKAAFKVRSRSSDG
jgi:hypothetical protein